MILHKTDGVKKVSICLIIIFSISFFSAAQLVRMPLTGINSKVQAYSSVQQDAFSFQGNQASVATIKNFSAGINCERRFMLKELSQYNGAVVLPVTSGNFAFAAGYAGDIAFNETQLGFAYGKKMGKLCLGAQFNFFQVKTQGYGKASSMNFEAGAIYKVNEKFNTGFHIFNPAGSRIGRNKEERLPVICSMGFGYDASAKFFIGSQLEKVEDQRVNLNASMHYEFAENIFAKAGISTAASCFYFGAGYLFNELRLDVTASMHQQLGPSTGLMLIYNKEKK